MSTADIGSHSVIDRHTRVNDHSGFRSVLPVAALSLVAVILMSLQNLADPIIRFDDYPAFFADPAGFWAKTLHEGRWVNYLWHLREIVTPAWLNFLLYQTLWAAFAAATAVCALRSKGLDFFAATAALMILVSPSAMLISLWFNTLIPGLAIVALYAVLACLFSQLTVRLLLVPFVVVSFMAYTTYPLLILAIALFSSQRRSLLDLFLLLALFTASFLLAVLTTYALNWQVHGVFGVPLADWRDAAPASDVAGYIANLPKLWDSFSNLLDKISFGFFPAAVFHMVLLLGGLAVLFRRTPLEALYLTAGLVTGFALVAVQVTKLGAIVPPRAFIFAWVIYAVIAVRAAKELTDASPLAGRLARNAVLLVVMSYGLQVFLQYGTYRAWQQQTQSWAAEVATLAGTLFIAGDPLELPSAQAAGIQNPLGLAFRLKQLTGQDVELCKDVPSVCAELAKQGSAKSLGSGVEIRKIESGGLLTFAKGS